VSTSKIVLYARASEAMLPGDYRKLLHKFYRVPTMNTIEARCFIDNLSMLSSNHLSCKNGLKGENENENEKNRMFGFSAPDIADSVCFPGFSSS
jgi:hypothetical protein